MVEQTTALATSPNSNGIHWIRFTSDLPPQAQAPGESRRGMVARGAGGGQQRGRAYLGAASRRRLIPGPVQPSPACRQVRRKPVRDLARSQRVQPDAARARERRKEQALASHQDVREAANHLDVEL